MKESYIMQQEADIREYWEVIKRRKFQFIIPGLLVFLLAALISLILPPVYKSTGTILIEAQGIPQNFVQSTVTGYVEERLQVISQIVLSRVRLVAIIDRFGLYQDLKKRHTIEEIVEKMREDITMEPIQAEVVNPQTGKSGLAMIAFTLSYEGNDPRKVVQVANLIVSLYLEENLRNREEKASATFEFLEDQLAKLREEIVIIEKKTAEFKKKHVHYLPELMQLNLQTMEQLQRQIEAKEEQIKGLINRKIYIEGQLAIVEPMMYTFSLDGKRVMTPRGEVESLRNQCLSLSATLSPQHPDVISLKKRLEALEAEVSTREDLRQLYRKLHDKERQLALISEKFSDKHPDVIKLKKEIGLLKEEVSALSEKQTVFKGEDEKPENPLYINLQTQIASIQIEIETIRKESNLLKVKYDEYQKRVENTPQVEQEYLVLQRDYNNARIKYQETANRLLVAREATGLEESQKAEKFTLIDSPMMPEKPDRPNRLAILLIGVVLAVGVGIGSGSLAEHMDQSVCRADELAAIAGYPVLAEIPYLETEEDRKKMMRMRWAFIVSTAGLVIIGIAAVHFLYRPIDILWIQIMQRFSIGF
jgi:protein tyrosine kinase modulator